MAQNKFPKIPRKDAMLVLYKKIRSLYRLGYSMDEIPDMLSCSKTTVFFALKGRAKKKEVKKKINGKG